MKREPTLRCEHCGRVVDPRSEFHACAGCGCNPATGVRETGDTHIGAEPARGNDPIATEQTFEEFLADAIQNYAERTGKSLRTVATFAEAGVLTRNKGLVVRLGDAEFEVTIARSR